MRIGQNPNYKLKLMDSYAPIIVGAITHLPVVSGYHAQRFDVVKLSLETMRRNAGTDCKIMVWDNGSGGVLRNWLVNVYQPDYLILSENVGKISARAGMVRMLPPGIVIGVADDDVLYSPNWLAKQVEVLQHFPNVGQVSGCPIRTQARWGNKNTIAWARANAEVEYKKEILPQYEADFCKSIGRDYKWHQQYTADDLDPVITFNGMSVIGTAHHMQWIGYTHRMLPLVRFDTEAMADEKPFDNAVDAAGLLRLTTIRRYTQHIGNVIDQDMREAALEYA